MFTFADITLLEDSMPSQAAIPTPPYLPKTRFLA